jgi:signal transduction histidine kinase
VTLTGAVSPQVDPVWMAPEKVSRVLRNLVENALKHTPPGGRIELRAEAAPREVLVTVRDTGAGIPAADLPRVFEPFYRGDLARTREGAGSPGQGALSGGAGLGLAIARGLVEAHGGRIWAESAPGQGTALNFTLPRP